MGNEMLLSLRLFKTETDCEGLVSQESPPLIRKGSGLWLQLWDSQIGGKGSLKNFFKYNHYMI